MSRSLVTLAALLSCTAGVQAQQFVDSAGNRYQLVPMQQQQQFQQVPAAAPLAQTLAPSSLLPQSFQQPQQFAQVQQVQQQQFQQVPVQQFAQQPQQQLIQVPQQQAQVRYVALGGVGRGTVGGCAGGNCGAARGTGGCSGGNCGGGGGASAGRGLFGRRR
jgi:hypothetical protein